MAVGNEAFIFVGLVFWLVYFAQSFENQYIRMLLKLAASFLAVGVASIPLIAAGLGNQAGLYDLFALTFINSMRGFWFIWFVVFLWELFKYFEDRKKEKLEGTQ